ncbi:Acg family FMN-binding oxidoreductase [Falsiroseomonas sp. HW251]|uniref:Acg family FMN-binding oxidoreductase n=1 Tax=Falsiroseomonas sp. HW251 TaxID=3390998 RepID=UPI003D31D3A5
MSLPRRSLLRAASGALALVPLGGVTVLRAADPDPLAPWAEAPRAAAHPDPRIRALSWAVLAPNPHNRQPWIAELPAAAPDTVVLRCDLDRRLPVTDPFDRQITIGLGAFAELCRLAAAEEGRAVAVSPFPEGEPGPRLDGRPVAILRFGAPGSAAPDPLFRQAAARRSAKRPYDTARPVAAESLAALGRVVAAPVRFGGTTDPDRVATIRDIAWRSWQIEATTEAAHLESVNLMRFGRTGVAANPDGISVWGPGIEEGVAAGQITRESMLPGGAGYRFMIERYAPMLAATPAYVWLTTGRGRADQLAAGRDWLRVNLAATAAGLSVHPLSQALQEFPEVAGPYAEMHGALAPDGATVQMLARLGYAAPVPPTPRWPVETRIRAV